MQRFRNQIWSPDPDCDQSKLSSIEQWLDFLKPLYPKGAIMIASIALKPKLFHTNFYSSENWLKIDWDTSPPFLSPTLPWLWRDQITAVVAFASLHSAADPSSRESERTDVKSWSAVGGSRMLKKGSKGGGQNVENKLIKIGGSKKLNMGSTKKGKLCRKWNVC